MDAAARKRAIVETAMPLFAGKGFTGTTTKEIAERAGVSEALLYRHFPTKAALYEAIQQLGCQIDPALDEMGSLSPSTATLVEMVEGMFQHIVFGAHEDAAVSKIRQRLMLQSLLADGEYARVLLSRVAGRCLPIFEASLAAARTAGDLEGKPLDPSHAFWFAAHVAVQIANSRLPASPVIPDDASLEDVTVQAMRFCLRGIGLTEAAIDRYRGRAIAPAAGMHQMNGGNSPDRPAADASTRRAGSEPGRPLTRPVG